MACNSLLFLVYVCTWHSSNDFTDSVNKGFPWLWAVTTHLERNQTASQVPVTWYCTLINIRSSKTHVGNIVLFLMLKIPVRDHATYALHDNAQLHSNSQALKHGAATSTASSKQHRSVSARHLHNTKPATSPSTSYLWPRTLYNELWSNDTQFWCMMTGTLLAYMTLKCMCSF